MKTIPFDSRLLPEAVSLELTGKTPDQAKEVMTKICSLSRIPSSFAELFVELCLQQTVEMYNCLKAVSMLSANEPSIILARNFTGWELSTDGVMIKLWVDSYLLHGDCWCITIQFLKGSRLRPQDYTQLLMNDSSIIGAACLPQNLWMTF